MTKTRTWPVGSEPIAGWRRVQASTGASRRLSHRGFTLLEMLIAMTLAALILTVVPASFSALLPHVENRSAVKALASTLRSLRGRAVRERTEQALLLDLEQRQYRPSGAEVSTDLPDTLSLAFHPQFDDGQPKSSVVIRFFPDGSSTGGTVDLLASDSRYELHVDWLSGRVEYREE